MLLPMIDRPNAEVTFQRAEDGLDLCQLHITGPQNCRVLRCQIGSQQVVTIALLRGAQLALVYLEVETLPGYRIPSERQMDLDEAEGAACFLLGSPDAQQQLIARRQTAAHRPKLAKQPGQALPPHGNLFGLASVAPRQHV